MCAFVCACARTRVCVILLRCCADFLARHCDLPVGSPLNTSVVAVTTNFSGANMKKLASSILTRRIGYEVGAGGQGRQRAFAEREYMDAVR